MNPENARFEARTGIRAFLFVVNRGTVHIPVLYSFTAIPQDF
jgi:hypothetical protein